VVAEDVPVAVVGAGQAGLAVSRELSARGVPHVVLERGRVGQSWRDRWDSFCLVTPNWTVRLPGHPYDGHDPDGFMPRDEVVAYLERYAAHVDAPVREGVEVTAVEPGSGGFRLVTSSGDLRARAVVVAAGTYRRPFRPAAAASLPPGLAQLDVDDYRSESQLPPGDVLVVGSGQSGCQIAEELNEAGRRVVLACGRAPWLPRRIGDRDLMWWALETGFLDAPVDSLPAPEARLWANMLATGHGGGHDLHLRVLRDAGVTLVGRFLGVECGEARFAPDLADSVAWGDERYRQFGGLVRRLVEERGLDDPGLGEPGPFDGTAPEQLPLDGFGAVIFACGFRPDLASWIAPPEAFDTLGFPRQRDGESTVAAGLFFLGVHFLRTRRSSLLVGVGEDAAVVAERVAPAA
jgi:putative flavoprotein involved in K+ transport